MPKFHTLKIKDIRQETGDTVSIAFDIPEGEEKDFEFINGQYITLREFIEGEDIRRSYSLSSCLKTDNEHRIAVKKVPGGRMSTWLNHEAKVGDTIHVMSPEGHFHPNFDAAVAKSYVLFAAGSGITPIISIVKGVLANEPNSQVVLFYGSKTEEDIIFKAELEQLQANNDRFKFYNILSRAEEEKKGLSIFKKKDVFKGRFDNKKVVALLNNFADLSVENEFFICGPNGMMDTIHNALKNLRVSEENIHVEYFATPDQEEEATPTSTGGGDATAVILLDGEEKEITIPAGTTILDAAIDNGLDAPYSCRGAVCSSCMAKLEEGEVKMKMNYILTDGEIDEGFIVTCQSTCVTDKVKVNYDI